MIVWCEAHLGHDRYCGKMATRQHEGRHFCYQHDPVRLGAHAAVRTAEQMLVEAAMAEFEARESIRSGAIERGNRACATHEACVRLDKARRNLQEVEVVRAMTGPSV